MATKASTLGDLIVDYLGKISPELLLARFGLGPKPTSWGARLLPLATLGAGLTAGAFSEEIRESVGLPRSRSRGPELATSLGLLAAGAALGAGVGMALSPRSGNELRRMAIENLDHLRQKVSPSKASAAYAPRPSVPRPAENPFGSSPPNGVHNRTS